MPAPIKIYTVFFSIQNPIKKFNSATHYESITSCNQQIHKYQNIEQTHKGEHLAENDTVVSNE